jgi:hypothetical protein
VSNGKLGPAHRLVFLNSPFAWPSGLARDEAVRSPLFCVDLLENGNVESLFSHQFLEALIFAFELFESDCVFNLKSTKLVAPPIKGMRRDCIFATQALNRIVTGFSFTKNANDLLFSKSAFFHACSFLTSERLSHINWLDFWVAGHFSLVVPEKVVKF